MSRARDMVFADVSARPEWHDEVEQGKMFGVLVVEGSDDVMARCASMLHDVDGAKVLFAYSGQILGRSDWDGYVPAIFDYLRPDGYFKRHEAEITALNRRVEQARRAGALADARSALDAAKRRADSEIAAYREFIKANKSTRTVREAQFQNAELRRIKRSTAAEVAFACAELEALESEIRDLKEERRRRSDTLQRWLFTQHKLALPQGRQRSLLQVFTDYVRFTGSSQALPPSGTGECCAPRLLNYANSHGLKAVALAELWYGNSPKGEVRHHGQFYEPCQAKCVPVLWAMEGRNSPLCVPQPSECRGSVLPEVLYEDDSLIAVNKPPGLLAVPGRNGQPNVEDILKTMRSDCPFLKMAHRLDMDTGGIIVAAKNRVTLSAMQKMFASHGEVDKQYIAILAAAEQDAIKPVAGKGEISIPLSSDYLNRPRQRVDYDNGKRAVTRYEFTAPLTDASFESVFGYTVADAFAAGNMSFRTVLLTPLTGRTHQLRLHCAHPDGLDMPILGDALYGNVAAKRMFLHARRLTFRHPTTNELLTITIPLCFKEQPS